jgi:hypothetical protein
MKFTKWPQEHAIQVEYPLSKIPGTISILDLGIFFLS